ncbi:MAG: thymidylate kinase [Clostridia bacterium]|nr:thymidylate kinase [Clostridia bacterium]
MHKIFVIDGTDGSGKKTQIKLVKEKLMRKGIKVASFPFPNYPSLSSGPVRMYLEGEISENPSDISKKAAASFYAIDRYITFQKDMKSIYEDNETVILLDRYTSANLIHQGSKIIEKYGLDEKKLDDFIEWTCNLEYNDLELPKPTRTFFMNMPIEMVNKLIENRPDEITGNTKKDIHERNVDHLKNSLASGLYTAKKLDWYVINCVKDNLLRTIDDINDEIFNEIMHEINN